MTDRTKKLLVIVVGAALIGAVVLYRSAQVVFEHVGERAEAHRRLEAECAAKVEREPENESPLPTYRSRIAYRRTTPPPGGAIRLATLRLPGRVAAHRRITESDTLQYQCLYDAIVALGGNSYVVERIEPDPAAPDDGKLVEGVYLVASPKLPAQHAARFPHRVSVVTDVFENSPAERSGVRPGDVFVDLDHRGLGEGAGESTEVDDAIIGLADGVAATVTVVRDGEVLDLPVMKERGKFGYRYQAAPLLP